MSVPLASPLRRAVIALWFLQSRSLVNQLRVRFKRLKQPKYMIGAVVGIGYFAMSALPAIFGVFRTGTHHGTPSIPGFWQGVRGMGILFWMTLNWVIPSSGVALQYTETELAFLLPSPIGRRTLIQYKILKSLLPLLFASFIFTVFRFGSGSAPLFVRLFGWWIVLIMLHLHAIAASFTMTRLFDRGVTPWWRRLLVLTMVAGLVGGSLWWLGRTTPGLDLTPSNFREEPARWLAALTATPPLSWILTPVNWAIAPRFSPTFGEFITRLPAAILVLGLHYLWVIQTEVSFEEASLAAAKRRSDLISAVRQGQHPLRAGKKRKISSPFRLSPVGFPPIAILWKNLISAGSGFSFRLFGIMALSMGIASFGIISGMSAGPHSGLIYGVFTIALMALGASLVVGPQMTRFDFRQDLQAVDLVKLYPLPGWQVVLGEMLAPVVILTCIQWLLLILLGGLSLGSQITEGFQIHLNVGERLLIVSCIGLLIPGFNFISLIVPNALTLLFPAWVQVGKEGPMGLEVMGQRMIVTFGGMIILAVSLIPVSAVCALIVWGSTILLTWHVGVIVATLVGVGLLMAETAAAIFFLGKVFDKLDLT